jgi:hypothetical protein
MNKLQKIAIGTLLLGGIIGYAVGEYDGDIIEPTAKYMKDRKINLLDIPETERCSIISGDDRLSPRGPVFKPAYLQNVDRIAVFFDYDYFISQVALACVEGQHKPSCERLGYENFKNPRLSSLLNQEKYKFLMPSSLKSLVDDAIEPYIKSCKKDIPITYHYVSTDDEFYMKGTLALTIRIDQISKEKWVFGASLYRNDIGFHYFDKMRYKEIELDLDFENVEEIHRKIRGLLLKYFR